MAIGSSQVRYIHSPYTFEGTVQIDMARLNYLFREETSPNHSDDESLGCITPQTASVHGEEIWEMESSNPSFSSDPCHKEMPAAPQVHQVEEGEDADETADAPVCDHVDHWKRLRSKRGHAYFLCYLCGRKWKTPTVQAYRYKTNNRAKPIYHADGFEFSAPANVSDANAGKHVRAHAYDNVHSQHQQQPQPRRPRNVHARDQYLGSYGY